MCIVHKLSIQFSGMPYIWIDTNKREWRPQVSVVGIQSRFIGTLQSTGRMNELLYLWKCLFREGLEASLNEVKFVLRERRYVRFFSHVEEKSIRFVHRLNLAAQNA